MGKPLRRRCPECGAVATRQKWSESGSPLRTPGACTWDKMKHGGTSYECHAAKGANMAKTKAKPEPLNHAKDNAAAWLASIVELVKRLEDAEERDDDEAVEEVRREIQEGPLSVEVRDGWKSPGAEGGEPEEFKILLSTGGPALRIVGDLGQHCTPETARLEYQDWYTPWIEYHEASEEKAQELAIKALHEKMELGGLELNTSDRNPIYIDDGVPCEIDDKHGPAALEMGDDDKGREYAAQERPIQRIKP